MAWAFLKMLGVNGRNPDVLSHTKCVLHKSKQWEYENKSLGGQLFKAKRGVNTAINKTKDTMNRIGSAVNSAQNKAKNAINSFIGNNITGQSRLGNNIDYVGNAVNTVKKKVKEGSKSDYKKRLQRIKSGYYD